MSDTLLLINAHVIPCTGLPAIENGALLIQGDRLAWVGESDGAPSTSGDVIDCQGKTLLPGLCDAHCHLYFDNVIDPYTLELSKPVEHAMVDAIVTAAKLIQLGITSVREVGTRGNISVILRDQVAQGRLSGPRIKAAKQIISTWGGLGDSHPTHLFRREQPGTAQSEIVTGPWEARNAVRQQVKDGVDWVKVEASGAGFSTQCPADRDTISAEELRAIVDEAKIRGRPVACHAESRNSIIKAARAGCRTIEHAVYLDDEGLEAVLQSGAAICPTLALYHAHAQSGLDHGMHPDSVDSYRRTVDRHIEAVRTAHAAGVVIIAGGDAGQPNFPQGGVLEEICAYVELAGMSEADALLTSTRNAAHVVGFEDSGTLEPGKIADVLILAENPLRRIRAIAEPGKVETVIQSGAVVAGELPPRHHAGVDTVVDARDSRG